MSNDIHLTFDALTVKGISTLNSIQDTLKDELKALTERDLDKIKENAESKAQLLNHFSENTQLRTNHLEQNNFQSSPESIQDFFNACQNSTKKKQLLENWIRLEEILLAVIDANAVNEQVLKRNQKNLEGILSILQGQQANNILYNAKGSKGDYAGQSRIGKA